MSATIEFPAALQKYVGNQSSVAVSPGTIRSAFEEITGKFSDLQTQLYDEDGKIRSFVNIYLNDEDIRYGQNMDTELKDGDSVQIVPSIAGG